MQQIVPSIANRGRTLLQLCKTFIQVSLRPEQHPLNLLLKPESHLVKEVKEFLLIAKKIF